MTTFLKKCSKEGREEGLGFVYYVNATANMTIYFASAIYIFGTFESPIEVY